MHGREEWVLVSIGSQHKLREWAVRSVFPDYLSVSCDYGKAEAYLEFKRASTSELFCEYT